MLMSEAKSSNLILKSLLLATFLAATYTGSTVAQTAGASASGPRESLERMVLHEINSANFDRTYPFEQSALVTELPLGVINEVNVSDDGIVDWLVDYSNSSLNNCGTGGCLRSLYVSDPDVGYILAFDDQTLEFAVAERKNRAVIDVTVHRVMCASGNEECEYAFVWEPSLKRLVEQANKRGETLVTAPIGVLDPSERAGFQFPEAAPEALQQLWRASAKACPSSYGDEALSITYAKVHSIPDLDGDSVRDWFYRAPSDCPAIDTSFAEPQPYQIYLSRADEDPKLAFTSGIGEQPVYDIATSPAMLISNPECGIDAPCRNLRLKWNAQTQSFAAAN